MRPKANPKHFQDLELVITLAEATRQYDVHRKTLTYAIDAGLIAATRCGRAVLISKTSLLAYLYPSRM